ncbi:MAG: electron transfer flavoprotein subunit beta/FixA family protein [Bowdeniella nasicola]|nr:electron transfer flavoprotein subunit beta/FixA family protein [Bowdeniella nasicola]
MKVAVLVKHVPDVQSERRIEDGHLVRGEDDVINELDENAVEAAVSLVEEIGGEVVAVTMGPEDAVDAVRRALQMGADSGLHVCDERLTGTDVLGTARVLAAAVRTLGDVDLVLAGMASSDGETSVVPAALAADLGWPVASVASRLECDGTTATIERTVDSIDESVRVRLPAVVSVTDQVNEPRIPAFKAMMAARKKPVTEIDLAELGLADDVEADAGALLGASGAGVRVRDASPIPAREQGTIVTDTGDGGTRLADYLKQVM